MVQWNFSPMFFSSQVLSQCFYKESFSLKLVMILDIKTKYTTPSFTIHSLLLNMFTWVIWKCFVLKHVRILNLNLCAFTYRFLFQYFYITVTFESNTSYFMLVHEHWCGDRLNHPANDLSLFLPCESKMVWHKNAFIIVII